ncbi:condensation domain-containing protein [Nocardia gipuzkoensis]|uniref:condensation domain-containing protein n=1 Tax=Nocardia gipuzkoensis TaxID=2749991 RepID=UPI00237EC5C6|nr:condensation domain-containing protein [Nocardia gipuzkoensis]MDE1675323.1 condensation domain-containing protein [Nocardia gipuzkoensis]
MGRQDIGGIGTQDSELFPLSPAQLGIWHEQRMDPQVPIAIAVYADLHGEVDVALLERALEDASRELGSWLLRIVERDGELLQYVDYSIAEWDEVGYVDLRRGDDLEASAMVWMRAEYSHPLNMVADRLIKVAALQLAYDHWFWYLRAHHVALNGFGAMVVVRRIAELYTAYVNGAEPVESKSTDLRTLYSQEIAYRDSEYCCADKEYWVQRGAGWEGTLGLAGRSAPLARINGVVGAVLSDEQNALLDTAVVRHGLPRPGLLIAGFAAYLAEWTGVEDVILGLVVTARTTAMRRCGSVVSNVVPLGLHVGHDTTIDALVKQVQAEVSAPCVISVIGMRTYAAPRGTRHRQQVAPVRSSRVHW